MDTVHVCKWEEIHAIDKHNRIIIIVFDFIQGGWGTRERSPPLPKIAHPSLPRLGRSHTSTQLSAMPGPPCGGTAYLITVSSVPGKLT